MGGIVPSPKKLEVFGASYLYPVLVRFGVIRETNFDKMDVCEQLKELTVGEYTETIIDNWDTTWPAFFVFYKNIQARNVYIKVNIRDQQSEKVFCVSFYFARYPKPDPLPYAN